jgi:hypothetical protein
MITALETARRLVLMATLLTLDTILPPSSSDAPRDARRRAAPRWTPGRAAHPDGATGGNARGRMAERTTMVAGPLPHGTPDARRSRQGDMPGHETVA